MTKAGFRRTVLFSVLALTAVSWIVLASAVIVFDLTRVELVGFALVAGLMTEISFWTGAIIGGWTLFAKRKAMFQRFFGSKSDPVTTGE